MNISDLYNDIGQIVLDICPANFLGAWARIEMLDDVWSSSIFYKKDNNRYGYINENLDNLNSKFRELRNAYKAMPGGPWTTATFWLSPDGKMKLDLGYDDISDFGKASTRRNVWISKYLDSALHIDWEG